MNMLEAFIYQYQEPLILIGASLLFLSLLRLAFIVVGGITAMIKKNL